MSLSALIRKRNRGGEVATPSAQSVSPIATATVATFATASPETPPSVATVANVAVANRQTVQAANDTEHDLDTLVCFAWLIHFTDREPVTVTFSPEVNHAGALACYPDAVAAEPTPTPKMAETELSPEKGKTDESQLRALIEAVYRDDTESDRNEALQAALADSDKALVCYTAIASERGLTLPDTDERHTCRQCANYTYSGMCSVATPGGLVSAQRGYRPGAMFQEEPHRCLAFKPKGQS